MPKGNKSGKGGRSSKTERVLSLLTDPENAVEEKPEETAEAAITPSVPAESADKTETLRADDADTQAQIRSALESELAEMMNGTTVQAPEPVPMGRLHSAGEVETVRPQLPELEVEADAAEQAVPEPMVRASRRREAAPEIQTQMPEPVQEVPMPPSVAAEAQNQPELSPEPPGSEPESAPDLKAAPVLAPIQAPIHIPDSVPAAATAAPPVTSAAPVQQSAPVSAPAAASATAPAVVPSPVPAPIPAPSRAAAESHEKEASEEADYTCLNVTQSLVEEKADKYIKMFNLCGCKRCRTDVIALALSNLPAKYVVVKNKDINPRLSFYESKYSPAVITQVMSACKRVHERPHHKR